MSTLVSAHSTNLHNDGRIRRRQQDADNAILSSCSPPFQDYSLGTAASRSLEGSIVKKIRVEAGKQYELSEDYVFMEKRPDPDAVRNSCVFLLRRSNPPGRKDESRPVPIYWKTR